MYYYKVNDFGFYKLPKTIDAYNFPKGTKVEEISEEEYISTVEGVVQNPFERNPMNSMDNLLFQSSKAAYFAYKAFDGEALPLDERDYLISVMRSYICSGEELFVDLGPVWCKTLASIVITMAKETPSIWDEFSDSEKESFDLIMTALVLMSKIGEADGNDYLTGLAFRGNHCKKWAPNHRLSNLPEIIFAIKYFGSANNVNGILINFDYDTFIEDLNRHGLYRTVSLFQNPGLELSDGTVSRSARDILLSGGKAYYKSVKYGFPNIFDGGNGSGVKSEFMWWSRSLDNPDKILRRLIDVVVRPLEEGVYEYRELNGHDSYGIRRSAKHASVDAILLMFIYTAAHKLGIVSLREIEERKISIPTDDLDAKIEAGYIGRSLGRAEIFGVENAEKLGYFYARSVWDSTIEQIFGGKGDE